MASIPETTLVRLFEMMVDRLGVLEDDRKTTHDTLAVIQRQLEEQRRFHFAAFLRANRFGAILKMFFRDSVYSKLVVSSPLEFFASKTIETVSITFLFVTGDVEIKENMIKDIRKNVGDIDIDHADVDQPLEKIVFTIPSLELIEFHPTWDMDEYDFYHQLNLRIDTIVHTIENIVSNRSVSVSIKKPDIDGEEDSDDEYASSDDEMDIDEGPVYDD